MRYHTISQNIRGRVAHSFIPLIVLLALAPGCGGHRDGAATPLRADLESALPALTPSSPAERQWQKLLARLWARSDHDDWDVISGWIDPATGGVVSGVPDSWPDAFEFAISIPPGAIEPRGLGVREPPVDPDPLMEIAILVPRYDPDLPPKQQHVAVYQMLPHGLQFNTPATVTFCYPPWRNPCESYAKFYFWRENEDGDWVYYLSDFEILVPTPGGDPRVGLQFTTTHFSRWGMQNGAGGEGIVDPDSLDVPPPPLPQVQPHGGN
ncbi:hypothetical protein FJ250_03395 [bacterium]|nr:hypothetical protein [bacterium]